MNSKIQTLMDIEGLETIEELFDTWEGDMRPGVLGICKNNGCDYSTNCDPDGNSWCEECNEASVVPFTIMMGII